MIIDFVQPGTSRGMVLQIIGSRKTVPPRMFLIVPFGLSHIFFNLNSTQLEHISVKLQLTSTFSTHSSVSTGPGPRPLRSNIASVRSRNIYWTKLGASVAFALLFFFISYKPHFTSATEKKVIDVTASNQ